MKYGAAALSNRELLALLLGTGTASESALQLAEKILVQARGLTGLVDMTVEELQQIKGVGPAKACVLLAAAELSFRLAEASRGSGPQVRSPRDAADLLMMEMKHLDREYFRIILLDTKHRVIDTPVISIGNLNSSIVHPRELFKECIRRSCCAVILVHNHPSGDPEPSSEDLEVTRRIVAAGRLLGINVLDHIIIGDNCFISLSERGLIRVGSDSPL